MRPNKSLLEAESDIMVHSAIHRRDRPDFAIAWAVYALVNTSLRGRTRYVPPVREAPKDVPSSPRSIRVVRVHKWIDDHIDLPTLFQRLQLRVRDVHG